MSSASIQSILFDIAPELTTTNPTALTRIGGFITRAMRHVNETLAGDTYDELVAYLVAHQLWMSEPLTTGGIAPVGGALLSEKVSKTSYTFANRGDHDGDHWETKYGRAFDGMMKGVLPYGPMALGPQDNIAYPAPGSLAYYPLGVSISGL